MRILHFNRKRERLADREALNVYIKQELNGADTIEFTETEVNVYQKYDSVAFDYQGKWYEYVLIKVEEDAVNGTRVYGENSLCELKDVIVDTSYRAKGETSATYNQERLLELLEGTNWHLRRNTFPGSVVVEHGDYPSLYDVLSLTLAPGERELETEIERSGNTLERYLRIVKSVGTDNGVRLEYRGRLGSLTRLVDDADVFTAILPVGGIVEHTEEGIPIDPEVQRAEEEALREAQKIAIEEDKEQAKILYDKDREGAVSVYIVNIQTLNATKEPGSSENDVSYTRGEELTIETFKQKNYVRYGKVSGTERWVDMRYVERKKKQPLSSYRTVTSADFKESDEEKERREQSKKPLTIETKTGAKIIEDEKATAEFGIPVNGKMVARIGVYRSNVTNIDVLHEEALAALETYKVPKITYQADVVESRLENLSLGDYVTIIDDELGVTLKERIISQEIEPDIDRRRVAIGTMERKTNALKNLTGQIVNRAKLEVASQWKGEVEILRTAVFDGKGVLVNYGQKEPQEPEEGDLWFRDNPDGTWSILVWDGEEWTVKIAEGFREELDAQIDSVKRETEQAILESDTFSDEVDRRIAQSTDAIVQELQSEDKSISSKVTQIESALESYVKTSEMETRLSQTEEGFLSLARQEIDGTNYLSKINQQAGHILFQVDENRFYISPDNTYMDNGVIGTAQIQDAAITTAKISEIDASQAIIKNIDASNITTGIITGPNSAWNLKTGYFNLGDALTYSPSEGLVLSSASKEALRGEKGDPGSPGKDGAPGEDGRGVASTEYEYAVSTSGETPPESGWSSEIPNVAANVYVWQRVKTTYTDGTTRLSTPECLTSQQVSLMLEEARSAIAEAAEGIRGYADAQREAAEQYADGVITDVENRITAAYEARVQEEMEGLNADFTARMQSRVSEIESTLQELQSYIWVDGGNVLLGRKGSFVALTLSPEEISFLVDAAKRGHFNAENLVVTNVKANMLEVNSPETTGRFQWRMRVVDSADHLTVYYVD